MRYGCHPYEATRPLKRGPRRILLMECPRCVGPKTLCSIKLSAADPLRIWLCLPCERRSAEEVRRAILTCEICGDETHGTMTCPKPPYTMPTTFVSKNHG